MSAGRLASLICIFGSALAIVSLAPGIAFAGPILPILKASEDASQFGNLAQGKTKCPSVNCGPTAAINSFVFLQNEYESVYGNKLIGNKGNVPNMADLVAAANDLACNFTLNCVPKKRRGTGTPIGDFILGKQEYIDSKLLPMKDTTTFAAEITPRWGPLVDPFHMQAKPGFVSDGTKPTAMFLYDQIAAGEDVEIDVRGPLAYHYLTVTGIDFNPNTGRGTLSVIDPLTGKPTKKPLNLQLLAMGPFAGFLDTNYGVDSVILDAVAESPAKRAVPEPAALALLLVALATLAVCRVAITPACAGRRCGGAGTRGRA